ncbi:MAG: histidine ammonia-lyase [Bacteroidetes bacterium]|nr:MAG: histidine ammonia-lyase [Bacteroidota bacterium]
MDYIINPATKLDFQVIASILEGKKKLVLSDEAKRRITACREYLDKKIASGAGPVYGINTGFGALYNVSIPENDLSQLQQNLVMSHACGTGEEVPHDVVRLMLLLKIQALSYGNSGVQLVTVERLVDFFNHDLLPVVYKQGSLGASGDLAPLAHLTLPLLGLGEVHFEGKKQDTAAALKKLGLAPIRLQSKEGLAMLNGTQFMSAYGTWCMLRAQKLAEAADMIGALSLEGYDGRPDPFHPNIQNIRPHNGQIAVAAHVRILLEGSMLIAQPKKHVQDPYSFRCMPQVHGASRDAIGYAAQVFQTEINSVTDNPTVFPEDDLLISGGNFHGQPLALALDFMAIALAELGSISERRTYLLISGQRGLPLFLVASPGLHSGFMIPQYTAASIVSQNKQLCTPASVDSIVSSNGQEDHVSMGANAATKCFDVVCNLERIFAIELMTAAQALEFRRPGKSSPALESMLADFRKQVSFVSEDRMLYKDIENSISFIQSYRFA